MSDFVSGISLLGASEGWGWIIALVIGSFFILGAIAVHLSGHDRNIGDAALEPAEPADSKGMQVARDTILILAVVGTGFGVMVPSFLKARKTSQQNACISNLRMIDAGKEQAALELRWESGDVPDIDAVNAYIKGETTPRCPGGGSYTYCLIGTNPRCSITHPTKHGLAGS